MSVVTQTRRVEVTYSLDLAVAGADPLPKRFAKSSIHPDQLSLVYRETASGWVLSSAAVSGRQVTKGGLGKNRFSERLWSADDWPEWVRDAVQHWAPKGSLR